MIGTANTGAFGRLDAFEWQLCRRVNRICRRPFVQAFFAGISRLGDGIFWYALIAAVAITQGPGGWVAALHMAVVGIAGVLVQKLIKHRTVRERPFFSHDDIELGAAAQDRYSFPSGHTLNAVAITAAALSHYPALAWVLVPFSLLTALARVVLGLHYPTDVLAGAAIGTVLAWLSFLA